VVKKMQVLQTPEAPRKSRGRPLSIDDESLRESRESLLLLLENTWGEVGWNLRRIKVPADVRDAFRPLGNYPNKCYVVDSLLRPSEKPATAKKLIAMRRRLSRLSKSISDAEESERRCRDALAMVDRVVSADFTEPEQERIRAEREKRASALKTVQEKLSPLNSEYQNQQATLLDGEAHFAQSEVLRFCKSRRYSLTPLNTANALAGLPLIGWRQSVKRCGKWERTTANIAYQVFKTITAIVNSCPRRDALPKHAEQWLRVRRRKSDAISELRQNWYYLRFSIEAALQEKPVVISRALPFKIASEYKRRKAKPSALDELLQDEEQIVVKRVAPANAAPPQEG
jgi:hypothetical protein